MFSKFILGICLLTMSLRSYSQGAQNIIIVTMDGMRWQEVFGGADTALLHDKRFASKDSA
ncbi:MAG: phosphoglyceromutase, partial [Pedobacter sp.]